ncbi:MAG: P-II family nitrogen regulator [Nitrosotalea sp.]
MKRIDAIIPEKSLHTVNMALRHAGVTGMTIFNTKGRGELTPEPMQLGGPAGFFIPAFAETITIMILTNDNGVESIVKSLMDSAGAGKIIVTNVENLIDIRKNKKDEQAL